MPKKTTSHKKADKLTTAFHAKSQDGTNLVGIGDLRVLITHEGNHWFAQGLEIDYAAEGSSLKGVQKNFQEGLKATLREHLRIYGDIGHVLRVAPNEVWKQMLSSGRKFTHSQVTVHRLDASQIPLPYDSIKYLQREAA